jgi:hypothetical protein
VTSSAEGGVELPDPPEFMLSFENMEPSLELVFFGGGVEDDEDGGTEEEETEEAE